MVFKFVRVLKDRIFLESVKYTLVFKGKYDDCYI